MRFQEILFEKKVSQQNRFLNSFFGRLRFFKSKISPLSYTTHAYSICSYGLMWPWNCSKLLYIAFYLFSGKPRRLSSALVKSISNSLKFKSDISVESNRSQVRVGRTDNLLLYIPFAQVVFRIRIHLESWIRIKEPITYKKLRKIGPTNKLYIFFLGITFDF